MTIIHQQMRRLLTLSGLTTDPLLQGRVHPTSKPREFSHWTRWRTPLVEKVVAWCDIQLFFL